MQLRDGRTHPFNYGPGLQAKHTVEAGFQALTYDDPKLRRRLGMDWRLGAWPQPDERAEPKNVYWVSEANMVVRSLTLAQLGGFDDRLRYHHAQHLALQARKSGQINQPPSVVFDPRLKATVKGTNNMLENMRQIPDELRVAARHGWRGYLSSRSHRVV